MKNKNILVWIGLLALLNGPLDAALVVKMDEPKLTGSKAAIKLTLRNTFKEKIESARATIFLIDDQGKMVGQKTAWVIGGAKDRPALASDSSTTFHFVVPADKPFTSAKLSFSRIILEGGKVANPQKDFEMAK